MTIKLTIPSDQVRTLHVLLKGGRIEARRTYPFPHHFKLVKHDGKAYATELGAGHIADLLGRGLIVPRSLDPRHDDIDYAITEAGKDMAAAGGVVEYDEPELFPADDSVVRGAA